MGWPYQKRREIFFVDSDWFLSIGKIRDISLMIIWIRKRRWQDGKRKKKEEKGEKQKKAHDFHDPKAIHFYYYIKTTPKLPLL